MLRTVWRNYNNEPHPSENVPPPGRRMSLRRLAFCRSEAHTAAPCTRISARQLQPPTNPASREDGGSRIPTSALGLDARPLARHGLTCPFPEPWHHAHTRRRRVDADARSAWSGSLARVPPPPGLRLSGGDRRSRGRDRPRQRPRGPVPLATRTMGASRRLRRDRRDRTVGDRCATSPSRSRPSTRLRKVGPRSSANADRPGSSVWWTHRGWRAPRAARRRVPQASCRASDRCPGRLSRRPARLAREDAAREASTPAVVASARRLRQAPRRRGRANGAAAPPALASGAVSRDLGPQARRSKTLHAKAAAGRVPRRDRDQRPASLVSAERPSAAR